MKAVLKIRKLGPDLKVVLKRIMFGDQKITIVNYNDDKGEFCSLDILNFIIVELTIIAEFFLEKE